MNDIDRKKYLNRYDERLVKYGYDPKTLGWGGSSKRQNLRFAIHMQLQNFTFGKKIKSVLDIGCGFGDMGSYLKQNFPKIAYTGIDINKKLVKVGFDRDSSLDLRVGNVLDMDLGSYDLVCESGIFNFKLENEDQVDYIEKMLSRFYELCNVGVSCDFMSTYVDFMHKQAFHMPENIAISLAKKITKRVVLRNDYLDYEYCLYLLKQK